MNQSFTRFLSLICLFLVSVSAFSQTNEHGWCAATEVHNSLLESNPEYQISFERQQAEVDRIAKYYQEHPEAYQKSRGTVYTIPCVVHVMHVGEAVGTQTNISEDQIRSAIDNMTDAYRNYLAPNESVDFEIEFCLATKDPDGNETNGINRINVVEEFNANGQSNLASTYNQDGIGRPGQPGIDDLEVKKLSVWPNKEYYNIWVVNKLNGGNQGGTQGYANFPTSYQFEGTVILANAFGYDPDGSKGYALKNFTRDNGTMVHEMGHALSLYHTFDNGDGNGVSCPSPENDCNTQGDRVCDIEPHKSNLGSCVPAGSPNECTGGVYTEVMSRNYMNYTNCQNLIYSEGQAIRARATMEGNCSNGLVRACLVQQSNLDKTGCNGENPPSANFTVNDQEICSGQSVQFTDKSLYGVDTYEWTFEGGTPGTSSLRDPSIQYDVPGTYRVTLRVINSFGEDTKVEEAYITVQEGGVIVGDDQFICAGDEAVIEASGASTYSWSPANGLSSTSAASPTASPTDTTVYTVTAVSDNGCESMDSVTVFILEGPEITVSNDTSVCPLEPVVRSAFGAVTYEWSPAANVVSGGNTANATLRASAETVFTVIGRDADGCGTAANITISLVDSPVPAIDGLDPSYCDDAPAVTVSGTPTGGTLSGSLSGGNQFDPSALGAGTYTIEYNYTDPITGCVGTAEEVVDVNPVPVVDFIGLPAEICESGAVTTLSGTPDGGTFSGPGVDPLTNTFNPADAGAGTHDITYTFAAGNCEGSITKTVNVTSSADIDIIGAQDFFCRDDDAVQLVGSPEGGDITGDVDLNDVFDPSTKDPGVYTVRYSIPTEPGACKASKTIAITVGPAIPQILGLDPNFCQGEEVIESFITQPAGGTTSGPGVTGNDLDVSQLPLGVSEVSYEITDDNGCTDIAIKEVTVSPAPTAGIANIEDVVCANNGPIQLQGQPDNSGVFSGQGVSFTTFDPKEVGFGPVVLTYVYTDANGCSDTAIVETMVRPEEVKLTGIEPGYCPDDAIQQFEGLPSSGVFAGPGMSSDGKFNPSIAGIGQHNIIYRYTDEFGCFNTDTQTAVVFELPEISFDGLPEQACENGELIFLNPSPKGGTFTGPGTEANSDVFDPQTAGFGIHDIQYTYEDRNGCVNTIENSVVIVETEPVDIFGVEDTVCVNDVPFNLVGAPSGGVFSGTGVGSDLFSPEAAGVGKTLVTYSYFSDETGCQSEAAIEITVLDKPEIVLLGIPSNLCQTEEKIQFFPEPSGGEFIGSGFDGDTLFPGTANTGVNTYRYKFTDQNGCSNFQEFEVFIKPVGDVSLFDFRNLYCVVEPPVEINAVPNNGDYTGKGIFNGNYFAAKAAENATSFPFIDTVTYTVNFANGCSRMLTEFVTITDELPEPPISKTGNIISTQDIAGYNYKWFRNGFVLEGETSPSITVSQGGNYSVQVGVSDFCIASSNTVDYYPTNISNTEESTIEVFPNPTSGTLFVQGNNLSNLELISLTGNKIDIQFSKTDLGYNIDLSNVSNGVYFIRVQENENIHLVKVLRKN